MRWPTALAARACLWLGMACAGAATAVAAETPAPALTRATAFSFPAPVRLLYALEGEVKKFSYQAHGELLWTQDGQHYTARLQISVPLLGERSRTSTGSITPRGLAPQRFVDAWRKEVAVDFDQPHQRASFSGDTPDVALQAAAQDQLSVVLQLAGMLAASPSRYLAGSTVALQTIGLHGSDVWVFSVDGSEKIRLPNATTPSIDSLRLTRTPRQPSDQKVELWLAPSMGYLPVRLTITQPNGDFIDQRLRSVATP